MDTRWDEGFIQVAEVVEAGIFKEIAAMGVVLDVDFVALQVFY